ncbi:kinase-like domain-containing protein [Podospora fimiseda]|uniref:Kinase-like domain-containing protein n=1 Tax=Podospora fimiseda TaxID=252190 RepID=A0AAN6YLB5_9PEZI|nr:kinase-like domain-containing protein [Podospora fimiseda]
MSSPIHVNDSIQAIDGTSWLIGEKILLSRQPSPPTNPNQPSWSDGRGAFFVLSNAPSPLPQFEAHSADSTELPRVYAAGDQSAVWRAGEAFIKAQNLTHPKRTREHTTLEFLQSKELFDFKIPHVLYHGEWDGRYYMIVSRVPGQTLTEAWPTMDEELRQYYVHRVADLCAKMAEWKGEAICGVDGGQLTELYLSKGKGVDPEILKENCVGMGMDVSCLVFYHCDLGPGNILVEPDNNRGIGIIDWETAGYVPREWVRTKFHLSSGMDFPDVEDMQKKSDWRRLVSRRLAEMGITEAIKGWVTFQDA